MFDVRKLEDIQWSAILVIMIVSFVAGMAFANLKICNYSLINDEP